MGVTLALDSKKQIPDAACSGGGQGGNGGDLVACGGDWRGTKYLMLVPWGTRTQQVGLFGDTS